MELFYFYFVISSCKNLPSIISMQVLIKVTDELQTKHTCSFPRTYACAWELPVVRLVGNRLWSVCYWLMLILLLVIFSVVRATNHLFTGWRTFWFTFPQCHHSSCNWIAWYAVFQSFQNNCLYCRCSHSSIIEFSGWCVLVF